VGKVTKAHIKEIVKEKWEDLNARDPQHAEAMIEGTARSMGIIVEG
jgi:large subunit ribosomal protein L11